MTLTCTHCARTHTYDDAHGDWPDGWVSERPRDGVPRCWCSSACYRGETKATTTDREAGRQEILNWPTPCGHFVADLMGDADGKPYCAACAADPEVRA